MCGRLSATDRLPLFLLPPSLSLPSLSISPALPSVYDLITEGTTSRLRAEESGKGGVEGGEEVHRSFCFFYGTEPKLGQGLKTEGSGGKSSQLRQQSNKSCPENQPADARKEKGGGITKKNMAAETLSCFCLLCILSGIFCPTSAARLGEQQQSLIKVRDLNQSNLFFLFLTVKLAVRAVGCVHLTSDKC